MYTPHTVTLYTTTTTANEMFEETATQHITVLRGVFLDHVKAANMWRSGLESADAVTLYIPLEIAGIDGQTLFEQHYVPEKQYEEMPGNAFTLKTNGDSFFVKGEVIEPDKDFQWINAHYDNVYRITKVDLKDFGTKDMQHIEVGGA